jgi:hypothetical protein
MFKLPHIIICLLVVCSLPGVAQKTLQITAERLGTIKIYELGLDETFEYKLKGDFFYRKGDIADLQDTIIFLRDETTLTFSDLKGIRIRKQQHLFRTFQGVFLIGGVGLFALTAFNNALLKNPPIIRENITYISAGMVVTSFLIYEMGIRHIHMNKRKTLKILDRDYNHLNAK